MTTNDRTEPGVCRPLEKRFRCPSCWQRRFYFKSNLDYHMQRKHGTGQQPHRPDVCPLCGDCVTCGSERVVEGTNANAGTWSPCPTCTGQQPAQPDKSHVTYNSDGSVSIDVKAAAQQYARNRRAREYPKDPVTNGVVQPAQPGSGGVRPVRGRISAGCDTYIGESDDLWYSAEAYRRLQSALTAAKAYSDDLETRYHTAHERLTAAQQRIVELESELENERARGIHTCHDQCQRPLCVAQRRIAELRGCLAELTALVNGESPALLNEDSGGDGELAVRIDNALEDPS